MKSRLLIAIISVGVIAAFATSCGGGSYGQHYNGPSVGPAAIINGSNLATISSHWVGANCSVKVELAGDGEFGSSVTDTSGTTTFSTGTWVPSGMNGASSTGGGAWVDGLANISGSTYSKGFSAGVGVYDTYQQNLGTCTFTLQSGALP